MAALPRNVHVMLAFSRHALSLGLVNKFIPALYLIPFYMESLCKSFSWGHFSVYNLCDAPTSWPVPLGDAAVLLRKACVLGVTVYHSVGRLFNTLCLWLWVRFCASLMDIHYCKYLVITSLYDGCSHITLASLELKISQQIFEIKFLSVFNISQISSVSRRAK